MVDVVCSAVPPPDARVHAEVSIRAGGSAVNAAVAAAAAGASAAVVGRIGSDPAAELVVAELAELGIEANLARDHDFPTGVAVSLGADPSSPSVVANRGANARLSPEDIPEPIEADALFVSGFALFQTGSSEAARTALDRFAGAWAGIDVGSPTLAAAAREADFGEAGRRRTVVLTTADEARAMTGKSRSRPPACSRHALRSPASSSARRAPWRLPATRWSGERSNLSFAGRPLEPATRSAQSSWSLSQRAILSDARSNWPARRVLARPRGEPSLVASAAASERRGRRASACRLQTSRPTASRTVAARHG